MPIIWGVRPPGHGVGTNLEGRSQRRDHVPVVRRIQEIGSHIHLLALFVFDPDVGAIPLDWFTKPEVNLLHASGVDRLGSGIAADQFSMGGDRRWQEGSEQESENERGQQM